MVIANLSPAERDALEDLEHNLDLIGARPLPCGIEWALGRARQSHIPQRGRLDSLLT